MRKRLILHIGMHKTGSSSIQHFLSRNRLALAAAGVLYPRSVGPDGRRQPKHNAIFSAISHEIDHGAPHPVLGPSSEVIDAMARRIAVSRAKTAILSAEGFSGENPAFARCYIVDETLAFFAIDLQVVPTTFRAIRYRNAEPGGLSGKHRIHIFSGDREVVTLG